MSVLISPRDRAMIWTAAVAAVAYTVIVFLVGFFLGGWASDEAPAQGLATTPQPEVRLAPNNVVAERDPVKEAKPPVPPPEGATITGTVHGTLRPKRLPVESATGGDAHIPLCSCEDVEFWLTTLRDKTGERVQVYSPNADVVTAVHNPVLGEIRGEPYRNAFGVTWRPLAGGDNALGLLYQRDVLARLRLGAKVEYEKEKGLQGELQALIPF